jgi:hypothetical protein
MSRTVQTGLLAAVLAAGMLIGVASTRAFEAPQPAHNMSCGETSTPQVRTTLYFGTDRPKGSVSELEWQMFLRDEVTTRFPAGLTAWDAQGQWRTQDGSVANERAKVLLIVHPDTADANAKLQAVITKYRKNFDQESVLWETARVCAAS